MVFYTKKKKDCHQSVVFLLIENTLNKMIENINFIITNKPSVLLK